MEGVPQPHLGDLRSARLLTTYPSPGMILQVRFPLQNHHIYSFGNPPQVGRAMGLFNKNDIFVAGNKAHALQRLI